MNLFRLPSAGRLLAGVLSLGLLLGASVALADAPVRVYVASTGSDGAVGSRTAPKRTFQAAHDAVAAGGEIVVLDTAGYGVLLINKSVTVTVPPGVNGFIVPNIDPSHSTFGVRVDAASTDVVTLRGLVITGTDPSAPVVGIDMFTVGTLRVEDCTLSRMQIGIRAFGGLNPYLIVTRSRAYDLMIGIGAVFPTEMMVTDCKIDGCSSDGIYVNNNGSSSPSTVTVSRCALSDCDNGIRMRGEGATAYVDGCTIFANNYGVATNNNGFLITRGNNSFAGNVNDGAFVASIPAR